MDDSELTDRIKDVFIRVLDLPHGRDDLHENLSLYSPLIQMDSLALLQVLTAVESELGIQIDDEDVMDADFTTVGSLVAVVVAADARRSEGRADAARLD